ncbi:PAS domain S-box [Burkholderiales bacterium JOSHI_001]|nr:PAS domain S-box [Burkholderiales bacterium JOSHI_001]
MNIDTAALVQAVGDAVVVCDASGAIVAWNPGAERMFGFSAAEALGAPLDIIIPERLKKRHWDGYHVTMATGVTKYGHDVLRVPAVDKAGRAMSIAFTVAMLNGADGKPEAIVSVIRDETERFAQERALKKRIADLEAAAAAGGAPAASACPAAGHPAEAPPPRGCPHA